MTEIAKVWHANSSGSCAVVIPKQIAQRQGIYERGSAVIIRETDEGVLLKKLEVSD